MKIFTLLGNSRSGIDFLQSLFDGHTQISQFPGVFDFSNFFEKIHNFKKAKDIAIVFIKQNPHFFDSRLNLRERHNKLGIKKNDFYLIDKKKFIKFFILFEKKFTNKSIFFNLHFAYSKASGDKKKKKVIIFNLHNSTNSLKELDFILNENLLFMIRHPICALDSQFKHFMDYNSRLIDNWWFHYQLDRMFFHLYKFSSKFKKTHVIKLEDLHKKNYFILKKICRLMNIKYENILSKSTYHKKQWWGDSLSKKFLKGVNPKFTDKIKYNSFFDRDIKVLEKCLINFMKKYKFNFFGRKLEGDIAKLKLYLPMKIELTIWRNLLKNFFIIKIFLIPYYYLKRIIVMRKAMKTNILFPESL